jgi:hypothetical protein
MHIRQGNLWSEILIADYIFVSTNATVNRAGELTMGRGAALEAKQRFPTLPRKFARNLENRGLVGNFYGIIEPVSVGGTECQIGAFQTKVHWRDKADLELIWFSCKCLAAFSRGKQLEIGHPPRIVMNYPGIGEGRLSMEDVQPILEQSLGEISNLFIYTK